jgi:hypothetical protein
MNSSTFLHTSITDTSRNVADLYGRMIKIDNKKTEWEGMNRIHLAQDRSKVQDVVNLRI